MEDIRIKEVQESFARLKMMQFFGAQMESVSQGMVTIRLQKQDFMARPAGMFNGGVIATLVDTASGYAAASSKVKDSYFVTVEMKVNYLNPAIGEALLAKAEVIKNGKVISVVRTDIFAVQGESQILAATSLVTMMQIRKREM